jgi:hypothetical protein
MAFSGKATYSGGSGMPEAAEDVSDLVSIASPHDTPLLDALGDPLRAARSTVHEWLEDELLPNTDRLAEGTIVNPESTAQVPVQHGNRFRAGDQVRMEGGREVMLVTAVDEESNVLTVTRNYGGSSSSPLIAGAAVVILGNAALEGDDAAAARFTVRSRKVNYTQIFTSSVEVSGSELAVRQTAVADELDYQKQQRTRELLRDLENCVINGQAPAASPEGSSTVRRTMKGIMGFLSTNLFLPGNGDFPASTALTEEQLNLALRKIWKNSSGQVDLIVVGGPEKRAINGFVASNRRYAGGEETFKDAVSVYESDFGICRVILCRWVPAGTVLLLDSSRIDVMPLSGRSFQYKPLAASGDREGGQVIGEYTMELRNEMAHGAIVGLGN